MHKSLASINGKQSKQYTRIGWILKTQKEAAKQLQQLNNYHGDIQPLIDMLAEEEDFLVLRD